MIVKAAIIGALFGGVVGLFIGAPIETAITCAILGIVLRKKLLHIFWK